MFEIDGGEAKDGRPVLPFSRNELEGEDALIVQVKTLSNNLLEGQEVLRAVTRAIQGKRVNGKPISVVVTSENIEMNISDMKLLAAHITPHVMKALGIPGH